MIFLIELKTVPQELLCFQVIGINIIVEVNMLQLLESNILKKSLALFFNYGIIIVPPISKVTKDASNLELGIKLEKS